ncbi:MAG: menaquinone biosynthesis protein [Planctomycetales bacterium]|jgi:chorismate dehydratase|nr:menaquinone biosynthesis protein [Planctomycetales bacterium]
MFRIMTNQTQNSVLAAQMQIGAVSYLNSRPLIEGLEGLLPSANLVLDYPSRLADALSNGQLDVALIPSIEYFRRPGYEVISDACVAARGEVLSVKLYCRVHPGQIRTLALDEGSRTSAALTKVILAERYGVIPKTEPLRMESTTTDSGADAVLLIGDRAMHSPEESFVKVMDLGQFWYDWTGLPFVFAMWVARREVNTEGVDEALSHARDLGIANVADIAREEAPRLGISETLAHTYLTRNLHYHLTSAERSGLKLFSELAAQHNLVKPNVDIVYRDLITA